jgi:hypothetical protein
MPGQDQTTTTDTVTVRGSGKCDWCGETTSADIQIPATPGLKAVASRVTCQIPDCGMGMGVTWCGWVPRDCA